MVTPRGHRILRYTLGPIDVRRSRTKVLDVFFSSCFFARLAYRCIVILPAARLYGQPVKRMFLGITNTATLPFLTPPLPPTTTQSSCCPCRPLQRGSPPLLPALAVVAGPPYDCARKLLFVLFVCLFVCLFLFLFFLFGIYLIYIVQKYAESTTVVIL